MRFVNIGSCVGADIIEKAKERGWQTCANFVSFSPLAILECENNGISLPDSVFTVETTAEKNRIKLDYDGGFFEKIKRQSPDYILVDLSDFRINVMVIEFENGRKICVTNRVVNEKTFENIKEYLESTIDSKISLITTKTPQDAIDEGYATKYYDALKSAFGEEKIILFMPKLVNQYVDGNTINHTPSFKIATNTNVLINKIYRSLREDVMYIEAPNNIIGDSSYTSPFEYHFAKPYYEYMIDAIQYFIDTRERKREVLNEMLKACSFKLYNLYNNVFCHQILNKISDKIDKEIALIAQTRAFNELLKEKYEKEICAFVEYNEDSDIEKIDEQVAQILKEHKDVIFVVPEMFNLGEEKGLNRVLYNNHCLLGAQYFVPNYNRVFIQKFFGSYEDIYQNKFESESTTNVVFLGAANKLNIGKSNVLGGVTLQNGATLKIGAKNNVPGINFRVLQEGVCKMGDSATAGDADITCHAYSRITIGNDVMFSFKEMIYSGDGHAIFCMQEDGSYKLQNPCTKDQITIGDHVWIGYECKLISGANIGDGSIIGAGSLVNKKFPNNVLLVGSPAKVVKRDIAWSRNVLVNCIEQDENLLDNFANKTKDL